MSLSTQTLHRLPAIKQGLLKGLNYSQIGKKCGVTEKTIDRDVKTWVESGNFETWIKEEWLRLHTQILHDCPELAYKEISRLMSRMVVQRAEIKSEVREEVKHEIVVSATEQDLLDSLARKYIKTKNAGQPNSIH